MAGTKWTHFAALGALAATAIVLVLVAAPAVGVEVLKPYQMDRLTAFVNPTENPAEEGYQVNQSLIAIGSGGRPAAATRRRRPSSTSCPSTTPISSSRVVGEEFGFMGAAIVLSLFALLIWRACAS